MSKYKNFFILFIFTFKLISFSILKEQSQEESYYVKPPGFSKISGFYPTKFKLKLSAEESTTIYYTTDSSDPRTSLTSKIYKDYILIYDKSSEPNIYSSIGTNNESPVSISNFYEYSGAFYPVDKAMIIRAVAKNIDNEFSDIISKTYFVTSEQLKYYQDLTVISIITNPENLFDPDIGIYVTGNKYFNKSGECNFHQKGKEWERESSIAVFDKGEIILQQKIGLRIKGRLTRGKASKSFNIFARKKYGKSTFETDIIKDNYDINGNLIKSYKTLSLRSIFEESRLKDKFGRDLFYQRKGLTYSNMVNSILFLNGEYWGFYLIQDKFDDNFFSNKYLIPKDNVVVIKDSKIEEGPEEELQKFVNFCELYSQKNLADNKIYEEINNYIDLDSLLEVFATGIYICNLDWPASNDGLWRNNGEKIKGNEYSDGRWRFIIFDLDYAMGVNYIYTNGHPSVNSFEYIERRKSQYFVGFFLELLKNNKDFQNKFSNLLCDYANDIYNIDKVSKLIEKYRDEYTELVTNSELRWAQFDYGSKLEGYAVYKDKYYKALDSLLYFFENRPNFIFKHLKEYVGLKGNLVDLNIEIIGKGKVQINTIIPRVINNKWNGKYYTRIPILIKAIPDIGYNFREWNGYIKSVKQNIEIVLFESEKIIVTFE